MKTITFGLFGRNPDARHYRFLWVLPVGFHLAANAINATIMKKTPGYGELFSVADVVLFYTTRPRITWFLSALLTVPWAGRRDNGRQHWSRNWVSFAYTQGFAEFALQAISLYTLIIANIHGKQLRDQGIDSPKSKTWGNSEMVIAALGWVAMFGFSCLLVLVFVCSCCGRKGRKDVNGGYGSGDNMDNEERGGRKGGHCGWFDYGWILVAVVAVALGCNWVFWDGYLREFPEEYCPPKLTVQAVIWVLFAALGIPFGVGF
ncbi:MAG: hypothetical protein CL912_29960 [Deltaproteobacteria bacterium]|nr:hypothetical protein [Deltaproteobacteria bacterium]